MGITLRNVTGSALTYNQMDENFRFLSQSYFYLSGSNIASGSLILTGSLNVSGGITGSLFGTASSATSASYALSASRATSASYAFNATSASYALSASNATSASYAFNATSASITNTASSVTPLNQNVIITGSLTVSGSSTFTNIGSAIFTGSMITTGSNTLIGNTVLSGSVNVSGSTTFNGTHIIQGSTTLSGSITVSGSSNFRNTIFIVTGSQFYTGSSVYIGNQTITGSLSLTSNGTGTGLFINGQKQFNYISAFHTASITPTQNTSGSFIYNTLITSSGITINNNSQITFANTGIYNIQFSAQIFTQTGANVYIWFKRNGTNIANSATRIGPTANNEYVVAAWNFVDTFTSSSYVEIAYQSDQTNTQFQYAAATGNIPAIPSVIVTVTQIA